MSPAKVSSSRDPSINYYTENIDFILNHELVLSKWIENVVIAEGKTLKSLSFIFCNDAYLHQINIQYLNHDTLTDVITFPYSTTNIEGDIFISIDRIKENANKFKVSFENELHRVIIHGVLHLSGYLDKEEAEKILIRKKENEYLQHLSQILK